MKNKTKLMIIFSIALIFIIFSIIICIILFSTEKLICTIKSINGDDIIVELSEDINNSDPLTKKQYILSISNIPIKDNEGKKIDKTTLKVEDVLCIIKKKENKKEDLAYSIEPLHNVKSIQLLKSE